MVQGSFCPSRHTRAIACGATHNVFIHYQHATCGDCTVRYVA